MTENNAVKWNGEAPFVDLDGVLVDYMKGWVAIGGSATEREKGKARAAIFKGHPHFYRHLDWMPDGKKLWDYVKQYGAKILSASSNFLPASKEDKHEWCGEELPLSGPRVIVVAMPEFKQRYCTPGAILIDDNKKNCAEWTAKGGIAILHTSADQTIKELKAIMGHQVESVTSHVEETFEQLAEGPICSNVIETFINL